MDVLVLGAGGLLGSNVVAAARTRDAEMVGTYHSNPPALNVPLEQFDIVDTEAFRQLVDTHAPDVVINCAAMTDVDACEENPTVAAEVNGEAPGKLALECAGRDIEFVHVSADYVFDGQAESPYGEESTPNPVQEYGQSKLAGERTVADAHPEPLITRLSFVWGIHHATGALTGFPAWVRERLSAGVQTPLVTDQYVSPSRAGATASTILNLLNEDCDGLFNIAARSCVTPYEFGAEFCARLGAEESLLEAGRQSDIDRPAARPTYTCLDVGKVEETLERRQPTLADDLKAVEPLL